MKSGTHLIVPEHVSFAIYAESQLEDARKMEYGQLVGSRFAKNVQKNTPNVVYNQGGHWQARPRVWITKRSFTITEPVRAMRKLREKNNQEFKSDVELPPGCEKVLR